MINPRLIASSVFDGLVLVARISLSHSLNEASIEDHVLFNVDQTALQHLLEMFAEDEFSDFRVGKSVSIVQDDLWRDLLSRSNLQELS